MSVKISFIIKDPKSSELQPVYVKVKKDGIVEKKHAGVMVQVVDGKIVNNSALQTRLRKVKKEILNLVDK